MTYWRFLAEQSFIQFPWKLEMICRNLSILSQDYYCSHLTTSCYQVAAHLHWSLWQQQWMPCQPLSYHLLQWKVVLKCLSKWLNVASENKIFAEKSFKSYQILSGRNWKLFKRKGIPFYEKSLSFSLEYFISWRFKVCKAVWKQLNGVEKPKK